MIRVLFICHGNICRSTMAQSVFQYMVDQSGLSDQFHIDSAATSREEIGNPPHRGTQRKLRQVGIPCIPHRALFFVKYFSLKKASEFPFFSKGFSLPSAGIMHPCA